MEEAKIMSLMVNFTIIELKEKGLDETDFEWKFNLSNANLIPILLLYDNDKIHESIEATEFSETLQDILKDIHYLHNWINQKYGSEAHDKFSNLLKVRAKECLECELLVTCIPIKFRNIIED